MSIDSIIRDGTGTRYQAKVTSDHALLTSPITVSTSSQSIGDLTRKKQYREWLRDPSGSEIMNVDGSTTPILFSETAEPGKVKWITSWRLLMHDTGMELETNDFRDFGVSHVSPGLTNGLQFYFEQAGRQIDVFLENVVRIGDFPNYSDDHVNLVNAVTSQSDFLSFRFDFDQPVALPAGSNDKIVMKISDDLSTLDYMRVLVRGWQEFVE